MTDSLPDDAFIHSGGQNRAEVAALLGRALELVVGLASSAADRPPLPNEPLIPEQPVGTDKLLTGLEHILKTSMNPTHPGWLAHMDPQPSTASLIGDLAAASVNNNMLSLEMSPAFTRLERALLKDIAKRFGLPETSGGVMASGGSLANLQALAVARNVKLGSADEGLWSRAKRPVLFCSEVAHTSVQKAAMLLGFGRGAVRTVAVDGNSKLRLDKLETAYEAALRTGEEPFCVVATAGTTTTGNIDPLSSIADFCEKHDLWFHVDAAYGGALVFSETYRHLLTGVEQADSVTFNPQKWLYVAKTCALALFRDIRVLETHFRTAAPYMGQSELINLGEISVQGTRHADVLKLWLTLQHLGTSGLTELIDRSIQLTVQLAEKLRAVPDLRFAGEPETNLLCFRLEPPGHEAAELDGLNGRLQRYLLETRHIFLSLPDYGGAKWLRVVVLNPHAGEAHMERLADGVRAFRSAGCTSATPAALG